MNFNRMVRSAVCAVSFAGSLLLAALPANAATVAYWRFEEGPADAQMPHLSGTNGVWSADTADSSGNGNDLSVFTGDAWAGYAYKADVAAATIPQTGAANNFSVRNTGDYPAMWNESLATWSPAAWTVEAVFKPQAGGYRTIVGRDSQGAGRTGVSAALAALYFQMQPDNSVAIKYEDAQGYWHEAISAANAVQGFNNTTDPTGATGKWYAMAAVSDGSRLSLYLNDLAAGTGYQLVAQTDLTTSGSTDTALTVGAGDGTDWNAGDFTVGRGLYNGGHVDRGYGFIDEVRLSDTALTPNQFLFAAPSQTEIRGTVKDTFTGNPVPGASVTVGPATTLTDSTGKYSLFNAPGTVLPITVTAPYGEASYSSTVTFPNAGFTTKDVSIAIRPHLDLSTTAGNTWQIQTNTGGAASFSAVAADETGFATVTVPGNWDAVAPEDDIYGWYRLHFTVPANFTTLIPNRLAVFRVTVNGSAIDEVDATWLNGTLIGQTGSFPEPPLDVQPAGHTNTTEGNAEVLFPGLRSKWTAERSYYFPTSLLKPGQDNVLAVKVFDHTGGGGIMGTPTLAIAPALAVVSGTVKAGGVGVAGVRVAATDAATGISSDWALTDATGKFILNHVQVGSMVIGAAKPGYTAAAQAVTTAPGVTQTVDLTVSAVTDAPAPLYDDFSDGPDGWKTKWDALSEANNTVDNAPMVTEPGIDVVTMFTIPSTLTVEGIVANRSGVLSRTRFNRFASVVSARLVSANSSTPEPTGGQPNAILQLKGDAVDDDPTQVSFSKWVEYDIEGYATLNGEQRIRIWFFGNGPRLGVAAAPVPIARLGDVTPTNPIEMTITRVGSYYDFYMNGQSIFDQNIPIENMVDEKAFLYTYGLASPTTWDWLRASSASIGPAPLAQAVRALKVAGGLEAAGGNFSSLNVVTTGSSASVVDILDSIALARQGL